ncbi:hypothetical protein EAF00_008930 [Botryotinia globosa]|nr:hypothetical protein EAF00_008930 [Botryotinia globosa]
MFHTCEMQIRGTNMTRKVERYVSQAFLLVLRSRNLEHLGAEVPVILHRFEHPSRASWSVIRSRSYGATRRMQRLYTCSALSPGIEIESLTRHHELTKCRYIFNKHYDSKSKFDWVHGNLEYEPSAQLLRAHSELAQSCLSLAFPNTQTSLRNLRRNTPLLHAIETQGGDVN